ncbi:hypothetical protein ACFFRR_003621 [Megaselia abdita]
MSEGSKRIRMDTNFQDLPVEMMLRIFFYHSFIELKTFSEVCKHWRDVIEDGFMLSDKLILKCKCDQIVKDSDLQGLKDSSRKYGKLLVTCACQTENAVRVLTTLGIKEIRTKFMHTKDVYELIKYAMSDLVSLDSKLVPEDPEDDGDLNANELFPNLKSIKLTISQKCHLDFLKKLFVLNSKTIQELDLSFGDHSTENETLDYDWSFLGEATNLKIIKFDVNMECTLNTENILEQIKSVEELQLSGFKIPEKILLNMNDFFPNLTKLRLSSIQNCHQLKIDLRR